MPNALEKYQVKYSGVEGYFMEMDQYIWDFLLGWQNSMGVRGGLCEIGVYKGKSAYLSALYAMPGDKVILADISPMDEIIANMRADLIDAVQEVARSCSFRKSDHYKDNVGKVRFFHVDGDHAGYSTYSDMIIATEMLGIHPVLVIDDFYNRNYPQLTAIVYKFLYERPDYKIFLCSVCKAYICRAEDFVQFEGLVRNGLPKHMSDLGMPITLRKSSDTHDMGCFAVVPREGDRDLAGRDSNLDDIPF